MDNYNYPLGADNKDAPWNHEDLEEREIEVLVSITLSKSVKIKVNDYTLDCGRDEDGLYCENIDYSNCDLKKAVKEQIYLPHQLNKVYSNPVVFIPPSVKKDFEGWNVDDFEVIIE
jgi:hypothetical protein